MGGAPISEDHRVAFGMQEALEMKYDDLVLAFEYVTMGGSYGNEVFVSRSTGQTFVRSELAGIDELPDDVLENEDYVELPDRNDLDLGNRLIWDFVDTEIPGLRDEVRRIFSHRGAYRRYKARLAELSLLEAWHRFEDQRVKKALLEWAGDHGITVED